MSARRGPKLAPLILLVVLAWLAAVPAWSAPIELTDSPKVTLRGVPFEVTVKNVSLSKQFVYWNSADLRGEVTPGVMLRSGESKMLRFWCPEASEWTLEAWSELANEERVSVSARSLPGWVSLIPPIIAIGLALATRQVLIALLFGIASGALLIQGSLFGAFTETLDTYLVNALVDKDHAFILLFTMSLGGMVALVSASGGMQGMVEWMSRYAKTPASTQVATWFMGVAIFFDDYANTLLVGQTMRPVTDKQKISREKLAYLVDSTAAPIASIALISTWIGYEMSLIQESFTELGITLNVYVAFLESILHRYYAILTLAFVFAVAYFHRDFGPMLKAERRALTGQVSKDHDETAPVTEEDEPTWGRSPWDAIIPVAVVLLGTLAGLWYTGASELGLGWTQLPQGETLTQRVGTLISAGNSFKALLWASAGGGIVAALISKLRYKVSFEQLTEVYMKGVTHMVASCVVLVLAWAIGDVCASLGTGPFLVEACRDFLSPRMLPVITFLLSAAVAFSTGTSWGTMAIVMPLAVRLSHQLPVEAGMGAEMGETILISTIAGVLAGATFGDHCSPISDTTIMSSLASGCNHVDHVNTQIPYAVTTAAFSLVLGALPAAYGWNPLLLNLLGIIACVAVVRYVGKPVTAETVEAPHE